MILLLLIIIHLYRSSHGEENVIGWVALWPITIKYKHVINYACKPYQKIPTPIFALNIVTKYALITL